MITILVDSREQRMLEFKCDWKRKGLKFGDYGCLFPPDYQYPLVWERKSIADLYSSLTWGYDRLRRCFDRAAKSNYEMILAIEGTREKVLKGYPHSARDPESVIKQLDTIHKKYGVSHHFFATRFQMASYIMDYYQKAYEQYLRDIDIAEKIANNNLGM